MISYDVILTTVRFGRLSNILFIWILSISSFFGETYKLLDSILQTSSNLVSSIKSIKIEKKKRRFDYIIHFLTIGLLFNSSIYIYKVFNIRDDSTVLNDVPKLNIMRKRTVLKVNSSVFLSKTILKIVSSFLSLLKTSFL